MPASKWGLWPDSDQSFRSSSIPLGLPNVGTAVTTEWVGHVSVTTVYSTGQVDFVPFLDCVWPVALRATLHQRTPAGREKALGKVGEEQVEEVGVSDVG